MEDALYSFFNHTLKKSLGYTDVFGYPHLQDNIIYLKRISYQEPNIKGVLLSNDNIVSGLKNNLKKFLSNYFNLIRIKFLIDDAYFGVIIQNNPRIITLNLGFNVMSNKVGGTEGTLVKVCQQAYHGGWKDVSHKISSCTYNAAKLLKDYDIFGLQEVHPSYVTAFEQLFKDSFKFICGAYVLVGYKEDIVGPGVSLTSPKHVLINRGMQVIWFPKIELIFINVHAPHNINLRLEIEKNLSKIKTDVKPKRVIMVGDFNDFKGTLLHTTIRAFGFDLKVPGSKKLITCCADTHYKYPGDCILTNYHSGSYGHPEGYVRGSPLISDHDPVVLV